MSTDRPAGNSGGELGDQQDVPTTLDVRERYVLYCLSEHGQMALRDLADEVTVWERDTLLPDVPPDECREVYLSLYHTHVPRLERAGLVDYASDRDLLSLSDAALGLACREPASPTGTSRP